MIWISFGKSTTRSSAHQLMISPASGRRLLLPLCSGPMPHTLQHLVWQSCGLFTYSLETSQSMSDASQIQVQQSISPTFPHSPTHFKTNSSLFMKNGRLNKRKSSCIATMNLCMASEHSYSMRTSSMLTSSESWCNARIVLNDTSIYRSSLILQITLRSEFYFCISLCHFSLLC